MSNVVFGGGRVYTCIDRGRDGLTRIPDTSKTKRYRCPHTCHKTVLGLGFRKLCRELKQRPKHRELFLREHIAGAYRPAAYYWAKSLADTPLQLLNALVFRCRTKEL
jgi:hypothetical protein